MDSDKKKHLNQLITSWPDGVVHSLKWLKKQGISQQLAYSYSKNGWLSSISAGVFSKASDKIRWHGALSSLQTELNIPVHVGSISALALQGHTHYIQFTPKEKVTLFKRKNCHIPEWLFNIDNDVILNIKYSSLFGISKKQYLTPHKIEKISIQISSRERAILEFFDTYNFKDSFEYGIQVLEGLQTLRYNILQELLEKCTSIKAKRLFLFISEKLNMPWFKKIKIKKIDLGTGKRVIAKNGVLNKKYLITVPKGNEESIF